MIFTQYYLDCLSQASYLIGDEVSGQAVVVDPRRDIEDYLTDAAALGLTIAGVINTHFHADFVSGHLELAAATGAWIGYGTAAQADFPIRRLGDGERISLGEVTLEIMHTPGHTPESISVLVFERSVDDIAHAVLTGDALFIGDVGRPDLLASVGVTADQLARMLHESVQTRLMGLPDAVRVFPAHGAGSACGKNLSTDKQSTVGEQRRINYACQPMSEEEFVAVVTEGQPAAPGYFLYNATLNKKDRTLRDLRHPIRQLTDSEVDAALSRGAAALDVRDAQDFTNAHLRSSISVPADGRLAETVGMVLPPDRDIVLLAPEGGESEAATRLARVGYDRVVGCLPEPEHYFQTHPSRVARASRLPAAAAAVALEHPSVQLVDLRNATEIAAGGIPGALHIPLAELDGRAAALDPARPVLLYCAGGWRSAVGASLLRHKGFHDVSDIIGGYTAWEGVHTQAR